MIGSNGWGSITHRVLSKPIKVRWAGWESDTHQLQRGGWEISAQEDVACRALQIALRHPEWEARGISQRIHDYDYFQDFQRMNSYGSPQAYEFGMQLGKSIHFHESGPPSVAFRAVDCTPQFVERQIKSLEDWAHFAPMPKAPQQIILPQEDDVNTLLTRILESQQGARRRYFEEQVREDKINVPLVHAQIITLRQAA